MVGANLFPDSWPGIVAFKPVSHFAPPLLVPAELAPFPPRGPGAFAALLSAADAAAASAAGTGWRLGGAPLQLFFTAVLHHDTAVPELLHVKDDATLELAVRLWRANNKTDALLLWVGSAARDDPPDSAPASATLGDLPSGLQPVPPAAEALAETPEAPPPVGGAAPPPLPLPHVHVCADTFADGGAAVTEETARRLRHAWGILDKVRLSPTAVLLLSTTVVRTKGELYVN